ncbi:hypothetical protein N752_11980 [Desulforamulus aquiferis]|nr:DMT family transporter [Desulforamulus aquiferis]RYD04898.1 hypothetical protein N752_11980 [Desulforamulus aquiferis]
MKINIKNREYLLANLAIAIAVIFWGVSFISTKIAVAEVPPTTLALVRFIIASVALGLLLKRVEPTTKVDKRDRPKMVLGGLLGITFYFYFENLGIKLTTVVNASLIVTIVPLVAILLDVLFFKSRLTTLKLLAALIAIVGTYLSVTANGQIDFSSTNFKGNLLMICAMLCWVFYTLVNKSLQRKYSGICMTTYQTIYGTLCLIPLSLLEYQEWRLFSLTTLGHILFLAFCCSVGCYILYMYALKHLDVAITTVYLNLVPVIGVSVDLSF